MEKKRMNRWLMVGAISLGFIGIGGAAYAQDILATYDRLPGSEGVTDRARPEYDAIGIPLGGFRLFPTFDFTSGYDSNVLRQEYKANIVDSFYFQEAGGFKLNSDWVRHELDFMGNVDTSHYIDLASENTTNWNIGTTGRLDVLRGLSLKAITTYGAKHEYRGSPDLPDYAANPTKFTDLYSEGVLEYHPTNLAVSVGGTFERFVYDPTPINGSATPLDNADRDENVATGYAKIAYEFVPGVATYVKVTYNNHNFDQTFDRNNLRRSAHGYQLDGGFHFMLTHLLAGELYGGYFKQYYKAPLNNGSGVSFGAKVDWYATPVMTVHLDALRRLNDTTIYYASNIDSKRVSPSFDWEVARNIIVQGSVGYERETFMNVLRRDDIYDAGIGAKYLINQYFVLDAQYQYKHRHSNMVGLNYNDSTVTVKLAAHL